MSFFRRFALAFVFCLVAVGVKAGPIKLTFEAEVTTSYTTSNPIYSPRTAILPFAISRGDRIGGSILVDATNVDASISYTTGYQALPMQVTFGATRLVTPRTTVHSSNDINPFYFVERSFDELFSRYVSTSTTTVITNGNPCEYYYWWRQQFFSPGGSIIVVDENGDGILEGDYFDGDGTQVGPPPKFDTVSINGFSPQWPTPENDLLWGVEFVFSGPQDTLQGAGIPQTQTEWHALLRSPHAPTLQLNFAYPSLRTATFTFAKVLNVSVVPEPQSMATIVLLTALPILRYRRTRT